MSLTPEKGVVHPRWVWAAVTCCVAGIVVLGIGVMSQSWWTAISGTVLLGVGALGGFRAGWMYDVHAARPAHAEVDELEAGGKRGGITPGHMIRDPAAEQTSAFLDDQRRRILARSTMASAPSAALGAGTLLMVAVVLLVAQWSVYPHTAVGQTNGLHSTYVAIVAALVGLRVLTAKGTPHLVAAGIGAVNGLALLLLAWLAPHYGTGVSVFESVCAVTLVLGSLACLSWRER